MRGYEALPEWVVEGEEPDPRLRDEGAGDGRAEYGETKNVSAGERLDGALLKQREEAQRLGLNGGVNGSGGGTGTRTGGGAAEKSLDDWLAESEESEEEEEDDEDDESEESSEEESSGEEESEGDEEDDGEEARLVK